MSITLTWGAVNAALADSIKVYRATTPIDVNNLPVPLDTIAGSATSYTDTTAVRDTTYYYVVGHVRGSNELLSQVLTMGHYPDTGPGPQTLIRGDWNCGYFGFIPTASFLSISQLRSLINNPDLGNTTPADGTVTGWHKFIRKGKVLFIPNGVFAAGTCTWWRLYNVGLVYGADNTGSAPVAITTLSSIPALVNQKVQIPFGAYNFLVRCPTVTDAPTNVYVPGSTAGDTSEWGSLMGRLGPTLFAASPQDKWGDVAPTWSLGAATQNFSSAKLEIIMGDTTGFDYASTADGATANNYVRWLPVLELILT